MALERDVRTVSMPAAADISAYQHRIVKVDTAGRVTISTGTADAKVGVLGNKPAGTAYAAQVAIGGVAKVYAGASVTAGDLVTSDGAGCGITAANTDVKTMVIGRALETAVGSAALFEVEIQPFVI